MEVGLTEKFAALELLPILVPPVLTVYQLIELPEEVAFKFELLPLQIVAGVAVTAVGVVGKGLTVTVTVFETIRSLSPALYKLQVIV